MPVQLLFDIAIEGELDDRGLSRLQKLLDLRPRGRLADTEDGEFGHRAVRDVQDEWVRLTLWRRRPDSGWGVTLEYAGPRPTDSVIDRCAGEVVAAASMERLVVTSIRPPGYVPRLVPERLRLPTRRSLSIRLTGGDRILGQWRVPARHVLRRTLDLNSERDGFGGTEIGWRYARFDPTGTSLRLELFDDPVSGTRIALLSDRVPPTDDVMTGVALQVAVAARRAGVMTDSGSAGMSVPIDGQDWADAARRAARQDSLRSVLPVIGCPDGTPHELTRGRLVMTTDQPQWQAASRALQDQAHRFLVNRPVPSG